jgi:hypothetical protein
MSGRRRTAIAAAVRNSDWERLSVALALAAIRLLETLPPDMTPELLALLDADDDPKVRGEALERNGANDVR